MSKIVNRTLDFFEVFAQQRRPLSLTELAQLMELPLSSCHDVVQALLARGYLYELKPRGGYYPTGRLFSLSRTINQNDPVALRAMPVLDRLSLRLSASVSLAKLIGEDVMYLAVSLAPIPMQFTVQVGDKLRNLYATSAGKACLGSLPPDERKALVQKLELKPLTGNTITSKTRLLADIAEGEQRGWFVNRGESVEDALTISTRFMWNESLYFIVAAGTLMRMERQLDSAATALVQAAEELAGPD